VSPTVAHLKKLESDTATLRGQLSVTFQTDSLELARQADLQMANVPKSLEAHITRSQDEVDSTYEVIWNVELIGMLPLLHHGNAPMSFAMVAAPKGGQAWSAPFQIKWAASEHIHTAKTATNSASQSSHE
jgi:hypothetical protein